MVVDVVYKLGPQWKCEWEDYEELRYSLRSLSNFKNLGKVWIVGDKPDWIKGVKHVPMIDAFTNADANIINKLIRVCLHEELSENFIQFSDDQMLLQPVTIADFIHPVKNNAVIAMEHMATGNKELTEWQTRLLNTSDYLKGLGLPNDMYEAHCPYLINKRMYPSIMVRHPFETEQLCGNTLYFNTIGAVPRSTAVVKRILYADREIRMEDFRLFFNYTGKAIRESEIVKEFLKAKYPEPSIYE